MTVCATDMPTVHDRFTPWQDTGAPYQRNSRYTYDTPHQLWDGRGVEKDADGQTIFPGHWRGMHVKGLPQNVGKDFSRVLYPEEKKHVRDFLELHSISMGDFVSHIGGGWAVSASYLFRMIKGSGTYTSPELRIKRILDLATITGWATRKAAPVEEGA